MVVGPMNLPINDEGYSHCNLTSAMMIVDT